MFKYLLLLFSFYLQMAQMKQTVQKIFRYRITRKMKIYQQEKQQKEAEVKKLEKDGFCPCSIQMSQGYF